MKFKDYFFALDVPARDAFAARCDTSRKHLTNIAYGQKTCAEKLAIAIERESGGSVSCEEMRGDVDWAFIRGTEKRAA